MMNRITSSIAFAAVLTALYVAAPFLPPGTTWGFHFLRYLGPGATAGFVLAVLILVVAVANRRARPAISRTAARAASTPLLIPVTALMLFIAAGFLFRVRAPLLGDSWFLVKNFAGAIQGNDVILPRDEPLATYYFSVVTRLFGVKTYAGFLDAFFAGGMVLGAGFILAAWATVRLMFRGEVERLASIFLICSLPVMVLFFGYVETYSAVLLVLSLYVLTGILYLRGRVPFALPALAFLLQFLTHYLTALTLPSLLYLAYAGWKRGETRQIAAGAAAFALAALIVLTAVGFNVENYFSQVPHRHYLPLTAPGDINERYSSPYTIFSPYHFTDLANLGLLLAGGAGFLLLAAFALPAARPREEDRRWTGAEKFLLSACGPVLLFALVAKFDLGTARDWDVIAPYSYVLTLFTLAAYFRRVPSGEDARPVILVGGVGLACSLVWFTVNASPSASVERFVGLLDPDVIGQGGMYNGTLYLSRYYTQTGAAEDRSASMWRRYVELYPGDVRGYRNVVTNMKGRSAEAVTATFTDWLRRYGHNAVTTGAVVSLSLESGNAALEQNRLDDAGRYFAAALAADSGSAAGWNNAGIVRARRGDFAGASRMFARAVEIDTAFADAWFNLGRTMVALGDTSGGRDAFRLSARFGNEAARRVLSATPGKE